MQKVTTQFYAAYSKSLNVVNNSSSGGIFYELCKKIILQGGTVYGAVQENITDILHKRAKKIEEIEKFQRSKYVRSDLNTCYMDVKKDLQSGKIVLFSGTGCQIAGLYKFLNKDYLQLYTVEVVCHGVPLTEAYIKYIHEKSILHGAEMKQINFRDKRYGWNKNAICEVYEDGEEDICLSELHPHHSLYLKGINIESGCGKCSFAHLPRVADISLADFWKYRGRLAEKNMDRGISLVVTNTSKGKGLYMSIKSEVFYDEVALDLASDSCRHLENAPYIHVNQRAFCKLIKIVTFQKASDLCTKFGDVIVPSELRTMHSEDMEYVFQSFLEDNQDIIYYLEMDGRIGGIVTFGAFIQAYKEGKKWINEDFKSVCLYDDLCIKKLEKIFQENAKINRIPITDNNGKLILEVRRTNGVNGKNDMRRFLLPFVRILKERRKCYFYKRPDLLNDFSYSKEEVERIERHLSFPVLSENMANYKRELQDILKERYSEEYIRELCKIPPIIRRGKRYQHTDCYSKCVNVCDGWRKTKYQPEKYKFTIHIYGRCGAFGYAVEDADTLPSRIQKIVRDNEIRVLNHSTWGAEDSYIIQNLWEDLKDGMIAGQDIILLYMNDLPITDELIKMGIYHNDTTKAFHQELGKSGVEFYDIPGHMNAEGYDFIARYICDDLKNDLEVQLIRVEQAVSLHDPIGKEFLNERQKKEIQEYIVSIQKALPFGILDHKNVGAIVMNCNPFTKGHRYLIEKAVEEVDIVLVFVVEEEHSEFSFSDRLEMVKIGVQDLDNVYVFPSGQYVISKYTLPDYIFKNQQRQAVIDMTLDVKIFAEYIAPAFHIVKRFLGTEHEDAVTQEYNRTQEQILPQYGIEVRVIERLENEGSPISAHSARKLIQAKDIAGLSDLLPDSTMEYIKRKMW